MRNPRRSTSPMERRVRRLLRAQAIGAIIGLIVVIAMRLWVRTHG